MRIILFLFILTACGSVTIHNEEVCLTLPAGMGGHCKDTVTTDQRNIPEPEWTQMQPGRISETSDAFAAWKIALDTLCNQTKNCVNDPKMQIMKKQMNDILQMAKTIKTQYELE